MAHLTLAGVSADGRRLLLVSDRGAEFTLDINPALRAALRGDTSRLGQLEIQMSSSLRPREIQTRIRAGESPEAVADAAGTTVQAIMPYVGPVVAERQHVAERAQRASLRRGAGESPGPSRVLGDTVAAHLRDRSVDPTTVAWDAYRRETGRWVLTADFDASERSGTARFTYDPPGNYALADNDDARWLVGDLAAPTPAAAPRDDLQEARQRRLASTPGDLPLGDDAIDLVNEAVNAPVNDPEPAPTATAATAETAEAPALDDEASRPADAPAAQDASAAEEPTRHRRPVQKKKGRASVPSWDEIMFGGGDQ